jgi:hypothetical protein
LRQVMLGVFAAGLAFNGCAAQSGDSLLRITSPTAPVNDMEVLVSKTLRRAVIDQKDMPGYEYLSDGDRIIVSSRIGSGPSAASFTAGGLPYSEDLEFVLLSPEQIKQLASLRGDFPYVSVEMFVMEGRKATVQIGVTWGTSRWSNQWHPSRGYILLYRKQGGEWVFDKVITSWSS